MEQAAQVEMSGLGVGEEAPAGEVVTAGPRLDNLGMPRKVCPPKSIWTAMHPNVPRTNLGRTRAAGSAAAVPVETGAVTAVVASCTAVPQSAAAVVLVAGAATEGYEHGILRMPRSLTRPTSTCWQDQAARTSPDTGPGTRPRRVATGRLPKRGGVSSSGAHGGGTSFDR